MPIQPLEGIRNRRIDLQSLGAANFRRIGQRLGEPGSIGWGRPFESGVKKLLHLRTRPYVRLLVPTRHRPDRDAEMPGERLVAHPE